jgi:SpoVK/Ycf46/Vps4 family AAA+-type ATPase
MQDKKDGAFVVATANDLSVFPPEFLRRGIFDEIFFVDFPDERGRTDIFKIHINKKKCDKDDELLNNLGKVCYDLAKHKNAQGCAGSDIEAVVNNATEKAWRNNNPLSSAILTKELEYITSLTKMLQGKIIIMRKKFEEYQLRPARFTEGDWQMFDVDGRKI